MRNLSEAARRDQVLHGKALLFGDRCKVREGDVRPPAAKQVDGVTGTEVLDHECILQY